MESWMYAYVKKHLIVYVKFVYALLYVFYLALIHILFIINTLFFKDA